MQNKISSKELREQFISKLSHYFSVSPEEASDEHYYKAVVLVVRDILSKKYTKFKKDFLKQNTKQIYYLCMEFLLGRSLKNNLFNLGIEETFSEVLSSFGIKLENLYEQEPDAGLGNGGLGRLAACFLDALATEKHPAMGYSLRYEYGIFKQKLIDGWQTELPDFWLNNGRIWFQSHPEKSIEVLLDGEIEENWDGEYHEVNIKNATRVTAVPYDMMIAGFEGKGISILRTWSAQSENFDMTLFNSGDYVRAVEQKATIEVITKVLYPEDNHPEGKSLRLAQQYFLVSATIQDIIHRHLRIHNTLDNLPEMTAIHLNDTHPVLAIPELMRVMLDECGYSWDNAWDIITRTVAYTNHTVMSEALECWSIDLFKRRLPRIYQIVNEINIRFCADMHKKGIDGYQVGRMAIINDGIVKMANLAIAASHSINGVSKLHSDILKETVFHDFYIVMPNKFKNVTNGIAYRRWLNQSNPQLANLITELIGDKFLTDASELKKLMAFKDNSSVLQSLDKIKHHNKLKILNYIKKHNGITLDPNSIFDVQVKRLHEYKRQHLNAIHILSTYQKLRENPNINFVPKTYIFGAKSAAGYYFAKEIIRFIVKLGNTINNDPLVKDKLKVVFLEDYDVTLAEKLIPASDISEQISLAGTEASGTSNMKFMINGAITLGTLDGANIEINDAVGPENILIFGMKANEVLNVKNSVYNPSIHYINNSTIRKAIDEIADGFGNIRFDNIANSLKTVDPYMVLADFSDYEKAQSKASQLYKNRELWNQMSLINISQAGRFSADRAIQEYCNNIWGAKPVQ